MLNPDEKVRMAELAFAGWVSDADLDAIDVIYRNATPAEKTRIKAAISPGDLSSPGQRSRLLAIFSR
jgi:hypothetical protein